MMRWLKKDSPGSDSFGNVWLNESVVEVTDEQAEVLLAIPDGGFSEIVEPSPESISESPEPEPESTPPPSKVTKAAPAGRRTVKE